MTSVNFHDNLLERVAANYGLFCGVDLYDPG